MKASMKTAAASALVMVLAGFAGSADASDRYRDNYRDGNYNQVVRCDSRDGRTNYCRMDTRGGVRLVEQYSDSACIRGRTWGTDRDAVWVSRGCRARFAADTRYGQGYGRGGRYDDRYDDRDDNRRYDNRYGGQTRILRCESRDGRYNFCSGYGYVRSAQVRRQLSDNSCRLNRSWGYRNGGIWVDDGCRAEFLVFN